MARSKTNILVAPFLKWVGGKRQLISEISENLPADLGKLKYFEPFIGGGAVFFHLQPNHAVINDFNKELINVYNVVKNNVTDLIESLKKHENTPEYFYNIRAQDRSPEIEDLSPIERASRIIYLNKTCFNGLYRVNSSGEFNVPFGYYKNPNIVNESTLKAVSSFLNQKKITILNGDYTIISERLTKKSFVYLDPPYHPLSETSNFTGYIQGGWDSKDQIKLREFCDDLDSQGIRFLLSNSAADLIKQQYHKYNILTVKANRFINSNASARGEIDELLIKNYE